MCSTIFSLSIILFRRKMAERMRKKREGGEGDRKTVKTFLPKHVPTADCAFVLRLKTSSFSCSFRFVSVVVVVVVSFLPLLTRRKTFSLFIVSILSFDRNTHLIHSNHGWIFFSLVQQEILLLLFFTYIERAKKEKDYVAE